MRRELLKLRLEDAFDACVRKRGQKRLALRRAERGQVRAGLGHDVKTGVRFGMREHQRFAAVEHGQRRGFARRLNEPVHRLL